MRQGLKLVVGLVLPLVVLVGCSQAEAESEPVITYPSETVEEPSETATEEWTVPSKEELYPYPKPEMPAIAQEHTQAGAEAFAKYFMEAHAYAMATRDPEVLSALCSDESEFCAYFIDIIEDCLETDSYMDGYYVQDLIVSGSLEGGTTDRVEWGAQVIGYSTPYTFMFGDGSEPGEFDEFHFVAGIEMYWDEGWKVEDASAGSYEEIYGE